MDEEPSQPTQPFLDPRRQGDSSLLSTEDEVDVLCILRPSSPAAYKAVQLVASTAPQHILQNEGMSEIVKCGDQILLEEGRTPQALSEAGSLIDDLDVVSPPRETFKGSGPALDIALRLSSKMKDPCLGFTFGRLSQRCDLVITEGRNLSISGTHFRIFVKENSVPMLEDTSRNGTSVDGKLLRALGAEPTPEKRRMLTTGCRIEVLCDKAVSNETVMRFIVDIPKRPRFPDQWRLKLSNYLKFVYQLERQAAVHNAAVLNGDIMTLAPKTPFTPLNGGPKEGAESSTDVTRNIAAWDQTNHFGMDWNGGDKYNVVAFLGSGAFAQVFQLATKSDGDLFAVKQIEKRAFMKNGILDQKINNEMLIMERLRHPNIVKFVEYNETPKYLYIIMDYVPCKDLSVYVQSGKAMLEFMVQSVARQICSALQYLHECDITHRDIKPENILVQSHDPLTVKLSDFGLSKRITNNDAYLKTFCGTILYCAPEIYPGYETYKSGLPRKRLRAGEKPLKTAPYNQSVDIWAFAAVLYHLLCGSPPFEGTSHAHMLERVMHTSVDYAKLKNAGVSTEGIDFVSRMLVVDPASRATEVECLQDPWLSEEQSKDAVPLPRSASVPRSLNPIGEDQEGQSASQMSQLSLGDFTQAETRDSDLDYDTDVDEIADTRRPKRIKYSHMQQDLEKPLGSSSGVIEYPSLPVNKDVSIAQSDAPGAIRLFGEIGESALGSSGVLDYNAHAALQLHLEEDSHDFTESLETTLSYSQNVKSVKTGSSQLNGHSCLPRQHPLSAPSLLGTEALVGQLNMASSGSSASAISEESKSVMRADTVCYISNLPGSKRPGQVFQSRGSAKGKRTKPDEEPLSQISTSYGSSVFSSAIENYNQVDAGDHKQNNGQAFSIDSNSKAQIQQSPNSDGQEVVPSVAGRCSSNTSPTNSTLQNDLSASKTDIVPPTPHFGVLTTLPGSACNTTIKLEQRWTSYGRDPASHVEYPDPMDVRVPRAAFDIIFWCPGLEVLLDSGAHWTEVEGIFPIVRTRTSLHIRVNGVKLTKGKNCWHYGRLHTGDIITVFGPSNGEVKEGKEAQFLKFRCEFFTGPSAKERELGSPRFVVEKEVEKFHLSQTTTSSHLGKLGENPGGRQRNEFGRQNAGERSHAAGEEKIIASATPTSITGRAINCHLNEPNVQQ